MHAAAHTSLQLEALAVLTANRKIELGPRPDRKQSCVRPPTIESSKVAEPPSVTHDDLDFLKNSGSPLAFPGSDDELEREERTAFGRPMGQSEGRMVDLDASDDE